MRRPARITLEVLGPPLLAAALLEIAALVTVREAGALAPFFLLVPFAYGLAGVPSVVFALVMELAFSLGLRPDDCRSERWLRAWPTGQA